MAEVRCYTHGRPELDTWSHQPYVPRIVYSYIDTIIWIETIKQQFLAPRGFRPPGLCQPVAFALQCPSWRGGAGWCASCPRCTDSSNQRIRFSSCFGRGHTPSNQISWALGGQDPSVHQPSSFSQGGPLCLPPCHPATQPLLCPRFRLALFCQPRCVASVASLL